MKTLVKTGKVIKIKPEDVLSSVYKYVKYEMNWNPDAFTKKLREISPYLDKLKLDGKVKLMGDNDVKSGIEIEVPVDTVILPVYMRDKDYLRFKFYEGLIEHKTKDVVDIEEFSLFDVYKVVDKPFGKLDKVYFSTWINYRKDINSYGIKMFGISISGGPNELSRIVGLYKTYLTFTAITEGSYDEEFIIKHLNTIKRLQGTPYSELPWIEAKSTDPYEENIRQGMLFIERDLTAVLNLIHFLHSHEFNENDIIGWLFKSYSDLVKSFGCEFDNALSSLIRVISAFMF
jgi:hypothetical protein